MYEVEVTLLNEELTDDDDYSVMFPTNEDAQEWMTMAMKTYSEHQIKVEMTIYRHCWQEVDPIYHRLNDKCEWIMNQTNG